MDLRMTIIAGCASNDITFCGRQHLYVFYSNKIKIYKSMCKSAKKWSSGSNEVDSRTTGHHFFCFQLKLPQECSQSQLVMILSGTKKNAKKLENFTILKLMPVSWSSVMTGWKPSSPYRMYWLVRDPGSLEWFPMVKPLQQIAAGSIFG